jgi:hypothetical protein
MRFEGFLKHAHGIAASYEGTLSQSYHRWRANRWLNAGPAGVFQAICVQYEKDKTSRKDAGAHWALHYMLRGWLVKPDYWDEDKVIGLAVKYDDAGIVEEFLRLPNEARLASLARALEAAPSAPIYIARRIAEKSSKVATGLVPAFSRLAERFPLFADSFRQHIVTIQATGMAKKPAAPPTAALPVAVPEPNCRHHFRWITSPGQTCEVCRRAISSDMVSEQRGKGCQHCGYAVHANCQ